MQKIRLVEVKKIPEAARRRGKWIDIVEQFLKSDIKKARIKTDMLARTVYPTVRSAIKRLGKEDIMTVMKRGKDVYLTKK